jgi:hypothetical protein
MSNPLSTRFSALSLASLMTTALLSVSGCSEVQLTYQTSSLTDLTQVTGGEAIRSQGAAETVLARLTLKTTLQIPPAALTGLRLRLVLIHDDAQDSLQNTSQNNAVRSQIIQQLELSAERFLSDPDVLWEDLPLGNTRLEVTLLDVSGSVIATLKNAFVLTEEGQQQVDFRLDHEIGASSAQMSLIYRPSLSGQADPLSMPSTSSAPEQVRFALPPSMSQSLGQSTSPGSASTTGPAASGNPVVGSSDNANSDLKLRLVESGQTRLLFFWEPPADVEVAYYRLLLEGKVIEVEHQSTNYRVENLLNNTTYAFTVQAMGKDGQVLSEQTLPAKTGAGTSSGGGGGGGGGGSSPPVNNPPVIMSLTATRTTLPATGYPVGLQASATDEAILPNTAYTWSCDACADASFNTSTGTASSGVGTDVIWNAPSTPGSYTLTLSVTDGVNAPVTRTQVIVVNQRLSTVIVEGSYQ